MLKKIKDCLNESFCGAIEILIRVFQANRSFPIDLCACRIPEHGYLIDFEGIQFSKSVIFFPGSPSSTIFSWSQSRSQSLFPVQWLVIGSPRLVPGSPKLVPRSPRKVLHLQGKSPGARVYGRPIGPLCGPTDWRRPPTQTPAQRPPAR